jgi:protein-S-isoprenylcysteine O-methyltransferase Ste14
MPFETPNKFIKQGPFRYSRNPIYLGMLLILSGAFLFLGNTLNLLLLVLFVYVMNKLIIINEEKVLEREFGSDYRNYKSSVKRWIL